MSMVASSEEGAMYLTKPFDCVRKYVEMIDNVPMGAVANRFGLAFLYKLSSYPQFPLPMIDSKIENYISQFIDAYKPKKTHAYFPIYYTALAYNVLTSQHTRDKVAKFSNRFAPFCVKLLEFFKKDLPSAAHQNILEAFKYMLADKEIFYRDLMVDSRGADTLRIYGSNLHSMFKGRQ